MMSIELRTSLRFLLPVLLFIGFGIFDHSVLLAQVDLDDSAQKDVRFSFLFRDGLPADTIVEKSPEPVYLDRTPPADELLNKIFLPIVSTEPIAVDETFIGHASPVYVADIHGRVYTNGRMPPNIAVVHTAELGANGRDPATWTVGDFTGFYPTAAAQTSQRSLNVDAYGDSAIQMQGFDVGFHLQSKPPSSDFPWQLSQYYYGFAPAIYPWSFGQHARFCIDHDAAVPVSEAEGGAVNYTYVAFAADDETTGETVWVSMSHYDPRQDLIDRGDFAHWWTEAADPIAYGFYGGDRYSSLLPGSSTSTSETWSEWRQFGFCMSYSQMQTILRDINNDFRLGISDLPENYGIRLFGIGPEMYVSEGSQGRLSMRIRDIHAFTLNSSDENVKWNRSMIRRAERHSVETSSAE